MDAIRGKWLTVDKRANIPEQVAKAVQMLCGHKVTLIIEGEAVKIVAVEECSQINPLPEGTLTHKSLSLVCDEAG